MSTSEAGGSGDASTCRIGVMAIQGAFIEHKRMLVLAGRELRANVEVVEVRQCAQLSGLSGLVIPGGESTTMSLFLENNGFGDPLKSWVAKERRPVWGTCAGLILLSNSLEGQKTGGQSLIGGLDVTTSRNSFGRQVQSFETKLQLKDPDLYMDQSGPSISAAPLTATSLSVQREECLGIFLRAPGIVSVDHPEVKVLAMVDDRVAAVRQNNIMATSFHPELTNDIRWHCYFLRMCM